ncbi:MAG: hypothetical protein KGL11_01430 [Alphaproteobacteria bacterium]|nr:hypothetical protein [Alphaproteobacteria bacterium]
MAEFRCYLLGSDRKVMAIESIRALTLPRAVTKGILAMVMRRAATFELWRSDLCIYVYQPPEVPREAVAAAPRPSPNMRRRILRG